MMCDVCVRVCDDKIRSVMCVKSKILEFAGMTLEIKESVLHTGVILIQTSDEQPCDRDIITIPRYVWVDVFSAIQSVMSSHEKD